MIELSQPARITCDEPGCGDYQPGIFVLAAQGGFAVLPRSKSWQLLNAANGLVHARCPMHHVQMPEASTTSATQVPK